MLSRPALQDEAAVRLSGTLDREVDGPHTSWVRNIGIMEEWKLLHCNRSTLGYVGISASLVFRSGLGIALGADRV